MTNNINQLNYQSLDKNWSIAPIMDFDVFVLIKKRLGLYDFIPCASKKVFDEKYLNGGGVFFGFLVHKYIKGFEFLVEIEPKSNLLDESSRFKFWYNDDKKNKSPNYNLKDWIARYDETKTFGDKILKIIGNVKFKDLAMYVLLRISKETDKRYKGTFHQPINLVGWKKVEMIPSELNINNFQQYFRISDDQNNIHRYKDKKEDCDKIKDILDDNLNTIKKVLEEDYEVEDVSNLEITVERNSSNGYQTFIKYSGSKINRESRAILNLKKFNSTRRMVWMAKSKEELDSDDNYLIVREWCDTKDEVQKILDYIKQHPQDDDKYFEYKLYKIKQRSSDVSFSENYMDEIMYRLKSLNTHCKRCL